MKHTFKDFIVWACPDNADYRFILLVVLTILMWVNFAYADQYIVEVDPVTKAQLSSYVLTDGESIPVSTADRTIVVLSKEEYEAVSDSSTWAKDWTNWLKTPANTLKVDLAIAQPVPKTVEEELAELKAKVEALETKP